MTRARRQGATGVVGGRIPALPAFLNTRTNVDNVQEYCGGPSSHPFHHRHIRLCMTELSLLSPFPTPLGPPFPVSLGSWGMVGLGGGEWRAARGPVVYGPIDGKGAVRAMRPQGRGEGTGAHELRLSILSSALGVSFLRRGLTRIGEGGRGSFRGVFCECYCRPYPSELGVVCIVFVGL